MKQAQPVKRAKPAGELPRASVSDKVREQLAKGPATALVSYRVSAATAKLSAASDEGRAKRADAVRAAASLYAATKAKALRTVEDGVEVTQEYPNLAVQEVRIDSPAALADLAAAPNVVSVQALKQYTLDTVPVNLSLIGQPQAAAAGYTGAGVGAAVIDSGVDWELGSVGDAFGDCSGGPGTGTCRIAQHQDLTSANVRDSDPAHHGTNVSGIVAAVAPGANLSVYNVFEETPDGLLADDTVILQALNDIVANASARNIRSVNMSLGTDELQTSECTESVYTSVFLTLRAMGVVPVVSSGNGAFQSGSFQSGVGAPACAPGAVRVGAVYPQNGETRSWGNPPCTDTDPQTDDVACFSQSSPILSLLAPGVGIQAAGITMTGTSQAAPHVTGAVADLVSARPAATSQQIVRALTTSGPTITDPRNNVTTHRLDIPAAAQAIQQPSAEITDEGCTASTLAANDDGSTSLVNLPFTANFFGATFPSLYVNNNGNVTFDGPLWNYTPFTIDAQTPRIIAPFLADVDTRGAGSSLVTYGQVEFGSRQALCVNWNRVGYYSYATDKLNSFQLLLVDRSDVGQGDFDIVMNYDAITWETGSASGGVNGFGGTSAGAGFSAGDGNAEHFFQFPGSMVHGGLLDTNATTGLVNGSRGTLQNGRYIFPIRNGAAPGSASIVGTVTDTNDNPKASAPVQACPVGGGSCVVGFTGANGNYAIVGMAAGSWNLTASPPAGSNLLPATAGPLTLGEGQQLTQNLVLTGPQGIPDDATITNNGETGDGVPIVYWGDPLQVTAEGCVGGTAQYTLAQDGNVLRTGPMAETPVGSGHYQGTVQPLYPDHGDARMTIDFTCPTPGTDPGDVVFDIYIDPSGTVIDTRGRPISGATVELRRSDTQGGPFAAVPDGSAIMSPSNRSNPVTTGADGVFHWDVLAGFYQVRANKAGCHVPNSEETVATSTVYEVPPPALDIELVLDCGEGGEGGGGGGGQAAVNLTWETPAPIAHPTPLSATQLSATAPVPGTFTYTKNGEPVTVGTVLPVGEHQVKVEFMPENLNAYLSASLTRTITVTRGQQVITVDPVATVPAGAATTTVTARGGASGLPVTFTSNTPEVCTVAGTDGTSPVTATIAIASAGTCTLVASQAGNENWDAAADVQVTFQIRSVPRAPILDRRVSANRVRAGGSLTAPALSTRQDEELLVALVSAAGPARKAQSVTAVTGGGLTWTRAARSNAAGGTTEVWQATTTAKLTDVKVTAKLKVAGVRGSITVAAFSGAGDQVTATAVGGARTGAPRAVLTPGASNSVVWAVGHNAAVAASVRVPAGQSVVHQYAEKKAKDSYWVQTVSSVTLAGTPIGVRATAPATGRWQLTAVEIPAAETVPTATLDRRVSGDRYRVGKNLVAPALTTRRENELLVAFLSADGPKAKRQEFTAVTGGGLTWTLAARSNNAGGTTEVWQAFSAAKLSKVRVAAKLKVAGYRGSITVAAFSGAGSELAATAVGSAGTGAPTVSLTPEAANSVVWAVGHNAAKAAVVRVPAGQSVVHQYAEKKAKDSYWVQTVNGLTRADTPVTVTASAPRTGRWQLVAVEIPVAGTLAGNTARR